MARKKAKGTELSVFKAVVYELKAKAYLALMIDSISLENLLNRTNEESATKILAAIPELIW
jgi:hypothetical protein